MAALVLLIGPLALADDGDRDRDLRWVATWATAPVSQPPGAAVNLDNQTLRQIVHISIGGERVRVKVSNAFGTAPLIVGAGHVARRDRDERIVPGSGGPLTFGGRPDITIPAGAIALSDPVRIDARPLGDLAIDLYLPGDTGATTSPLTEHTGALQTSYVSPAGDFTGATAFPVASTRASWFFLTGVEVTARDDVGAIVALGDSITDGTQSTPDANRRWPDDLARRIGAQPGRDMAVVNLGIAGNRVLNDGAGPNAQSRLDRDVLAQTSATHVIVLEAINDIGFQNFDPAFAVSADDIIAGHRQLIARAHARGLKIIGATLTPVEGSLYFAPDTEAKRQAVNAFIRTSGAYDAVIDFDRVTRDPARPTRFLPAFDSGDHLHPSDVGYQAMADAIDLRLFRSRRD
ncbi:MAG TPA: SGNH/GDSL hydrolase family protein [Kofleriaceae bacterium]|nr:SGNH/GDSL hydrolase family protein [Kofleriaceae bacterium]